MKIIFKYSSLLFFILLFAGCSLAKYGINYTKTSEPRFADYQVSDGSQLNGDSIKIVSYNIRFAKKIKKAVKLIENRVELNNADILLLQEMDEEGVKEIARSLQYNYVYYPAVFHPIPRQNFGNAILSKWPIIDDSKIILSEKNEKKLQRIAASATLDINGKKLMVFSVHMKISLKPFMRTIQTTRIIQSIPDDIDHCIIAGDFNTFTQVGYYAVINPFLKNGFEMASKKIGWTYKHWYTANKKFSLDHIFSKGMKTIDYGKVNNRSASDHIPVWAIFSFN